MPNLLEIENLKVWFNTTSAIVPTVDGVSFSINSGETYALLGESGSGKTVTALTISQLFSDTSFAEISGSIKFKGEDLLNKSELAMQQIRGNKIGFIFQEPMTALNPILTVKEQIFEVLNPPKLSKVHELLNQVGLNNVTKVAELYPHQLSGGMRQRVMIAMALATEPELLIADEPTTALDVTTQTQILALIKSLQQTHNMSVLLITHDLGIVLDIVDKVGIIYRGQIVEEAIPADIFNNPRHPYTLKLLQALPNFAKRGQQLTVIKNATAAVKGCRFANHCDYVAHECRKDEIKIETVQPNHLVRCIQQWAITPQSGLALATTNHESKPLLKATNIEVNFKTKKGLFATDINAAVAGVSFNLHSGKTLALVGESGCGKSSLAKTIVGLNKQFKGELKFQGLPMNFKNSRQLKIWHKNIQIIFQDPYSSINPRMMIKDVVAEGAVALKIWQYDIETKVKNLLAQVGLGGDILYRYPHEFSGGQRQRIVIARALAVNPKVLICDEPTSSLDVSVQAQVLNLLKNLQIELNLAYLFITHNLHAVAWLADTIHVMYLGKIVESSTAGNILKSPRHPYTELLLDSLPDIQKIKKLKVVSSEIDFSTITGCAFQSRCCKVSKVCKLQVPELKSIASDHLIACFNPS